MTKAKTTSAVDARKRPKKLSLEKKTLRDLETRGSARRVKGGKPITSL